MEWNLLKWPLSCISGTLVIIFYCIFTFISVAFYPFPYSPLTHWLSDLGNSYWNLTDVLNGYWQYNPNGGVFYNLGCILTGAALFPFFGGLYKWYTEEKWRKIFIMITQIIGLFSAFALIMIGIFSEDFMEAHVFWSNVFFDLILVILIITNITLFNHPDFIRPFAYYGFIVAAVNVSFVFTDSPLLEWFTVFSALGFVFLIVYNMYKTKFAS